MTFNFVETFLLEFTCGGGYSMMLEKSTWRAYRPASVACERLRGRSAGRRTPFIGRFCGVMRVCCVILFSRFVSFLLIFSVFILARVSSSSCQLETVKILNCEHFSSFFFVLRQVRYV